jgi:hypothetical protein
VSICAPPTAPFAIMLELIPPVATETVPLTLIGPPVSPAPVATLVTVPPLLVSGAQVGVPSSASDCTYQPLGHVGATVRRCTPGSPVVALKAAFGDGVSSWRGLSVVKAPPEPPGRAPTWSQRLLPANALAPKSRVTVNRPLETDTLVSVIWEPTGPER